MNAAQVTEAVPWWVVFSLWDVLGLGTLVLCWVGYGVLPRFLPRNVASRMNHLRYVWMCAMLHREVRIVDAQLHAALMHGVAFFASTALILVGGLLAVFGGSNQALQQVAAWSLIDTAPWLLQLKVLLMAALFAYAFFKFAWAYRLFHYIAINIGAAPEAGELRNISAVGEALASLHRIAAGHFNRGLQSFYFGLAMLGWFIHPGLLLGLSVLVVIVLYRRDYLSKFGQALDQLEQAVSIERSPKSSPKH